MSPRSFPRPPVLALGLLLAAAPATALAQESGGSTDSAAAVREAEARAAAEDPVEAAPHRLVLELELPARAEGMSSVPLDFDAGEAGTRKLGPLERLLADPVLVVLRTRTVDFSVRDRPVSFQFRREGGRGNTLRLEVGLLKRPRYEVERADEGPVPDGGGGVGPVAPSSRLADFDVETEVLELHLRGQGRLVADGPDSTVVRIALPGSEGPGPGGRSGGSGSDSAGGGGGV